MDNLELEKERLGIPPDLGYLCRCCGHKNFKNSESAWCDYCFWRKIVTDGKHTCELDKRS